jgi:hypothetical protein
MISQMTVAMYSVLISGPHFDPARQTYIQPVAVYGTENRRTEEQYAKDHRETLKAIHDRYAATGEIVCAGDIRRGSAQLTLRNDLITTAGHMFRDSKTCDEKAQAAGCIFTLRSGARSRSIPVKDLVAIGLQCPESHTIQDDWAILRLSEPATDVTPYNVDRELVGNTQTGDGVVAVARSMDFAVIVVKDGRPVYDFPKHIGDCNIRLSWAGAWPPMPGEVRTPTEFRTDCATSAYSSGGSLLTRGDRPSLLAIVKGGIATEAEELEGLRTGKPVQKPYDPSSWYTVWTPVAGQFYDALVKAAQKAVSGSGE